MIEFVLHPDTREDCRRISTKHPGSWIRILAALKAAEEDDALLNHLTDYHFRTYAGFDIDTKRWAEAGKHGINLNRLRFFALEDNGLNYRVVYTVDSQNDYCYILAILRREEIDYDDPNNPFTARIFSACTELGL